MTKAAALKRATAAQKRLDLAQKAATAQAEVRDATLAEAQTAGATYADMEQATGLSTSRVTQILRRARG